MSSCLEESAPKITGDADGNRIVLNSVFLPTLRRSYDVYDEARVTWLEHTHAHARTHARTRPPARARATKRSNVSSFRIITKNIPEMVNGLKQHDAF